MPNPIVEPGTMLYDVWNKRIGWVVGKHEWDDEVVKEYRSEHNDWDIEWVNGKREYLSEGSLRIYIKQFNDLANGNGKR